MIESVRHVCLRPKGIHPGGDSTTDLLRQVRPRCEELLEVAWNCLWEHRVERRAYLNRFSTRHLGSNPVSSAPVTYKKDESTAKP